MLALRLNEVTGRLPTSSFDVLKDGKPVGVVQVRHKPSVSEIMPPEVPNHIYYGIDKNERGKGYGREAFRLALKAASEIGLSEVFVTVHENNPSSRAIVASSGGKLLGRHMDKEYNTVLYYSFTTTEV